MYIKSALSLVSFHWYFDYFENFLCLVRIFLGSVSLYDKTTGEELERKETEIPFDCQKYVSFWFAWEDSLLEFGKDENEIHTSDPMSFLQS